MVRAELVDELPAVLRYRRGSGQAVTPPGAQHWIFGKAPSDAAEERTGTGVDGGEERCLRRKYWWAGIALRR